MRVWVVDAAAPQDTDADTYRYTDRDRQLKNVIRRIDLEAFIHSKESEPEQGTSLLIITLKEMAKNLAYELKFPDFYDMIQSVPRVSGQRVAFVKSINLEYMLARHIPPGIMGDWLAGARTVMDVFGMERALDSFCADVRSVFTKAVAALKSDAEGSRSAFEANSKFDGFLGSFATLEEFNQGAEKTLQLAYPNPDGLKGILHEHTAQPGSWRIFRPSNYQIATCLAVEYWWAMDPYNPPEEVKRFIDASNGNVTHSTQIPIFPGELGDSFFESLALFKIIGQSDSLALLGRTEFLQDEFIKLQILQSDQEIFRGLKFLDHKACLDWIAKSSEMLHKESSLRQGMLPSNLAKTSELSEDYLFLGIILPISIVKLEQKVETIKRVLVPYVLDTVSIAHVSLFCKIFKYCKYVSIMDLQKKLHEMPLDRLKVVAFEEWNVKDEVLKLTGRKEVISEISDRFVQEELRNDFGEALMYATDTQVEQSSFLNIGALIMMEPTHQSVIWLLPSRQRKAGMRQLRSGSRFTLNASKADRSLD